MTEQKAMRADKISSMDSIIIHHINKQTNAFLQSLQQNNVEVFEEYVRMLFEHLYNMRKTAALLYKNGLIKFLYDAFMYVKDSYAMPNRTSADYYKIYRIGGTFAVYLSWIENNFRESPAQLTKIIPEAAEKNIPNK